MKTKPMVGITLSLCIALLVTSIAVAFPQSQSRSQSTSNRGARWVDADGDGICDNAGTANCQGPRMGQGGNGGVCPQGNTPGQGNGGRGQRNGSGQGKRLRDGSCGRTNAL